ncbi:unnamed protein product [Ectocarpus sp. 4 AP-2014]
MSSEGGEHTERFDTDTIIIFWVVYGLILNGSLFLLILWSDGRLAELLGELIECGSDRDRCQPGSCCFHAQGMMIVFLCASLGPLPLAIVLCWCLWRYPCRFCIDLPRQAGEYRRSVRCHRFLLEGMVTFLRQLCATGNNTRPFFQRDFYFSLFDLNRYCQGFLFLSLANNRTQ